MSLSPICLELKFRGEYFIFFSWFFNYFQKKRPGTSQQQSKSEGTEADVEKFRRKLKERGGNGILGLGRQFRVKLKFFFIL